MNKILVILIICAIGCSGNNTEDASTAPAADTLMDSTTRQMKADTTMKRLDNLEDSIKLLRDKAAQEN